MFHYHFGALLPVDGKDANKSIMNAIYIFILSERFCDSRDFCACREVVGTYGSMSL